MKYMLVVGGKPESVFSTFDEAKNAAASYLGDGVKVEIEARAKPAPIRRWIYDRKLSDWVEQVS